VESHLHDQSERSPEAVAVVDGNDRWTYAELESRSNQVASWLTAHGIGADDVVAIHVPKSGGLVAALFGVLKAGAAFMILDPAHPPARLIDHLQQVRPRGWIGIDAELPVTAEVAEFVAAAPFAARLALPRSSAGSAADPLLTFSTQAPRLARDPDDRAYVAFTSGSTGTPKAVEGTHRPLSHFLQWHAEAFSLTSADRFAMLSGLGHDPLLRDIFTPLWLGATLYIPSPSILGVPGELLDWMQEERITVVHLTPVMGRLLAGAALDGNGARDARLPSLRAVFFGGDRLTRFDLSQLRRLAPAAAPINFYGATETPQAMAYFNAAPNASLDAGASSATDLVPLGHGIDDAQLLVLNGASRQAGVGERGEICVRTPYLCRGYLGDPDATRERFRPNPYGNEVDDRMYRTGDLGMYLADGAVAFLGRADDQVKIRGFRVEPAEVEARIRQHPGVQDVAVVAVGKGDGERRLTAYLVLNPLVRLALAELRRFVQARLPEYMAPAALVVLDRLPVTPNGKLDRRALPAPEPIHLDHEAAYVAPRGRLDRTVASVWCGVLGLKAVGLHDNFFDVGGSSLAMVEVHARLQQALGRQISIIDLFIHADIQSLVEYLGRPPTDQPSLKRAQQRIDARARARDQRSVALESRRQRRPPS
jgi:amino acid adenylation domain-containing protein